MQKVLFSYWTSGIARGVESTVFYMEPYRSRQVSLALPFLGGMAPKRKPEWGSLQNSTLYNTLYTTVLYTLHSTSLSWKYLQVQHLQQHPNLNFYGVSRSVQFFILKALLSIQNGGEKKYSPHIHTWQRQKSYDFIYANALKKIQQIAEQKSTSAVENNAKCGWEAQGAESLQSHLLFLCLE